MAKNQRLELTWFNKDKALLSEGDDYTYHWVSPRDPRYCETRNLVVDEVVTGAQTSKEEGRAYSERADLEPTTDNLLIRGDSGDVLEALTRIPEWSEKYLGKIKLIYIDPPFNTEKSFEHYADNLEHSVWLTMMRDRLLNLKKLLADDGSIWVHLDDHENHRMRLLLDEIFGAGNFMAEVVWQKADSPRRGDGFSVDHDNIIVYRKTPGTHLHKMPRTEAENVRFQNPDNDPKGRWWDGDPTANKGDGSGGMCYAIQNPLTGEMMRPPAGGSWRLKQETYFTELNKWVPYRYENLHDAEWRARNEGVPVEKASDDVCAIVLDVPLDEAREMVESRRKKPNLPLILIRSTGGLGRKTYIPSTGTNPRTLWFNEEVGHNRAAKSEITKLFPTITPFTTPKPERLLERIIYIATDPGDIVMDVFAGSGTTAAVAHKMGRRWVTCELKKDNFDTFTVPRLTKVVKGEDPGGITVTEGGRVDATEHGLPEELEAPEAFKLTQGLSTIGKHVSAPVELDKVVNAAIRKDAKSDSPTLDSDEAKELRRLLRKLKTTEANEVDFLPYVRKVVGQKLKTEKFPDTINWRGGGSFQVAHLAPACYDYDPELEAVMLTEEATGTVLVCSVVTQLGFERTRTGAFDGKRGNMRLRVIEGLVTTDTVDQLLPLLGGDERLMLAATAVDDSVRAYLRKACKGSVVKHVPDDLFPVTDDMLEEDITAHLTDPTAIQEAN